MSDDSSSGFSLNEVTQLSETEAQLVGATTQVAAAVNRLRSGPRLTIPHSHSQAHINTLTLVQGRFEKNQWFSK